MKKLNYIKTSTHSTTSNLDYYGTKTRVESNLSCLKQDKITFNHGKLANIYIFYDVSKSINISNYPTLENCLFWGVRLTKNAESIRTNIQNMALDSIEKDLNQLLMKSVEMW